MAAKKNVKPMIEEEKEAEDYFGLAKTLKKRLREIGRDLEAERPEELIYLWICVTSEGLKQGFGEKTSELVRRPVQEWLNVVDEAASLGANWLVLSIADPLKDCEEVWPIGKWAQQVHGMTVGLHLKECDELREEDISLIRQLDAKKTRVLVRCESEKAIKALKKHGITVWTANPQPDGEVPNCQGPTRMIFVNERGVLYTCGLVEGDNAYRMGNVADSRLKNIISHPDTPRHVHDDIHVVSPSCDGCPALIANFFF